MPKYYAGIGSRFTPEDIMIKMSLIASILEKMQFILRSGGANGADSAFENGITDKYSSMNIYLPDLKFNGRTHDNKSYIYIESDESCEDYLRAKASLIYHPSKFNLKPAARKMMIRNYFQVHGRSTEEKSSFIICWTPNGANGKSIKTNWDDGGTGQAIRLASEENIPVYNLKDKRYSEMLAEDLVKLIMHNLNNSIYPDSECNTIKTTSLF